MSCSGRGRHQHLCHKTTSAAEDNNQALHGTQSQNQNPNLKRKDEVTKPDKSVTMATDYNSILRRGGGWGEAVQNPSNVNYSYHGNEGRVG